jgi:hypothetical protein
MPKRIWILAVGSVVLVAIFSLVLIAISNTRPPIRYFDLTRDATVGSRFSTILDKYGKPESETPNEDGGTIYCYATEVDWDKFIAHWRVWIEIDESGTIVRVRSKEVD